MQSMAVHIVCVVALLSKHGGLEVASAYFIASTNYYWELFLYDTKLVLIMRVKDGNGCMDDEVCDE
jgi:hypothetical protein